MTVLHPPKLTTLLLTVTFLLATVLTWFFSVENRRSQENYQKYVTKRLHSKLNASQEELNGIADIRSLEQLSFSHPTFLFEEGELTYWSDHRTVPSYKIVSASVGLKYVKLDFGKYLCVTEDLGKDRLVAQLILLQSNPEFVNQYVQPEFNRELFPQATISLDAAGNEELDIVDLDGKPVFGVTFDLESNMISPGAQKWAASFLLAALLCAFIYLNQWSWFMAQKGGLIRGSFVLVAGLIFMRVLMIYFQLPYEIYPFDLFNSRYYVSSEFNASLGDLLVNVCFLVSLTTFFYKFILDGSGKKAGPMRPIYIALFNVIGLLTLALHYGLIEDILTNSQIELDINQGLGFDIFRAVSIIIFFMSAVIWFQAGHLIYKVSQQLQVKGQLLSFAGAALVYTFLAWFYDWEILLIVMSQAIYLLLLFAFRLPEYLAGLRYSTLFYFFTASLIGSYVGTMAIYENFEFEELIDKQRFANDLLIENDLKGEYLIQQASTSIQEDIFIQSRMMSPLLSSDLIEQKIKRDYLGGYFDKYDLRVHLFKESGIPFEANSADSVLADIRTLYQVDEKYHTGYEDIFFISNLNSDQPKRYLSLIPINRYEILIGYMVLDLRLKKVIPHTVYPELLVDNRFIENRRSFDYAFYNNSILNYKAGTFNYEGIFDPQYFQKARIYSRGIEKGGYHHLAVKGSNDRTLVITSSVYPTSYIISNFSFLFLATVIGILFLLLLRLVDFRDRSIRLNFTSKIQLYLNLAFFVPLVITSIVVINTLNSSYKEEIDRSSIKKANSLKDHLVNYVDAYLQNKINREALSTEVTDIARYSQSDLNLFDIEGRLITSSQPQIFSNHLLSERINQKALLAIIEEDRDEIVLNESVGSLAYKTTYAAVKSFDSGELLGIVGIPFFGSKNHLRRQNVEAFTNILNIFTLVLIASLFVSNLSSRLLTHPLNLLTQKIRRTSLAEHNEPLNWKGGDEIGMVVDEYNKMLVNLEESKEALAKSQKESAWREIAKQVAHEIKNPLTPMKLSLQHLKRLLDTESENGNQYEKPIDNLLYQVDSLSDIATSFSAFAKMPIPENERFEFTAEVKRIVELFDNEDVEIDLQLPEEEYYIEGDQKLMGRIISNLIINGMQSVPKEIKPVIQIKLSASDRKLTLVVSDNGSGIPEEIQGKVFVPNFSTKDKGSGIGLAIAKRGIDHAGGNIWFETSDGGTSFFVDLPLSAG